MTHKEFLDSLKSDHPPKESPVIIALWYDARSDWHRAHETIQDLETREGFLIHAYLHRKEGDLSNASYWYHRANEKMPNTSLQEEWDALAVRFTN
jgi:hypothetical protein